MPPLDDNKMSEFISKATGLLEQMETSQKKQTDTFEFHEKQLELYKGLVNDSINLAERRWNNLRQTVIAIVGFVLVSLFSGGVAIDRRPTQDKIDKQLEEYTEKDEILGAFGSFSDDVFNVFEESEVLTNEERKEKQDYTERGVFFEIDPTYRTRNPKKIK